MNRSAILIAGVLMAIAVGCSRKPEPVTNTVPENKPAPKVAETGTVTVQFDMDMNPNAIISIAGNDYNPKDLEQPLALKAGTHKLTVNQPEFVLEPTELTLEPSQKKIVRVQVSYPDRRAAEWVLSLGGHVYVNDGEKNHAVGDPAKLPRQKFQLKIVRLFGAREKLTDEGLKNLKGVRLGELYLDETAVSDAGLAHIADLTTIFSMSLKRTRITDKGLEQLRGLKKIQNITFERTNLNGSGFQSLRKAPYFTVNLDGCPLTDEALEHLATMPNLCVLNLADSKISDRGLAYLLTAPKLHTVRLIGTGVTDQGLKSLHGLKTLTKLELARTQVTDAAIQELETALPKCKVSK